MAKEIKIKDYVDLAERVTILEEAPPPIPPTYDFGQTGWSLSLVLNWTFSVILLIALVPTINEIHRAHKQIRLLQDDTYFLKHWTIGGASVNNCEDVGASADGYRYFKCSK